VHELKQLVDHCLEELPVLAQELGVLAHNIPAAGDVQVRIGQQAYWPVITRMAKRD
jgi:hypothetical protein